MIGSVVDDHDVGGAVIVVPAVRRAAQLQPQLERFDQENRQP
jgi:hypothetical protein